MNTIDLSDCKVGSRIWFNGEVRPYTVRARSDNFLICTKPFAVKKTVLYCIVDIASKWRAPENLIFDRGAETDNQCIAMLGRIVSGETGLSIRRGIDLSVKKLKHE